MYVFDGLCYKHVNPSDSLRYREEQPHHCERSEAIAQTTDKLGASATASFFAVTAVVMRKGVKNPYFLRFPYPRIKSQCAYRG
jgi:hypothetical protein